MKKIEALADAIQKYSGALEPDSGGYEARNPGLLRAFSAKHARNADGLRIFNSWLDGYQALLFDLQVKISGKSRSKVDGDSTLRDLMRSYYLPDGTADYIAKFMRRALKNDAITAKTRLAELRD